jgi:general secretion pathway protein I
MTQHAGRGFTLIEVLVALAIVAIALTAGIKASAVLIGGVQRQADTVLAHVCAENALVAVRLSRQLPSIGDAASTCEQAGRTLTVTLAVQPTPNPSFRRVDAKVSDGASPILTVSSIVGRY